MKFTTIILISFLFFTCDFNKSEKIKPVNLHSKICYIEAQHIDYQNVFRKEIRQFGDTLKVVFEYKGDKTIQKIIDLKRKSDNNFDNSYTINTTWSTRKNTNLECEKKFLIKIKELDYYFCLSEALDLIKSEIKNYDNSHRKNDLEKTKSILSSLTYEEKIETVKTIDIGLFLIEKFIQNLKFTICHSKNINKISFVRIGKYKASFFGGYEYLFIDTKNDTIEKFKGSEYMN